MRPYINDNPLRRLNIPKFSGGVNYRDGISQVLDQQLIDCKNVWYKNGLLKTRPGIKCADRIEESIVDRDFLPIYEGSRRRVYAKKENVVVVDGVTYFLMVIQNADRIILRYYADQNSFHNIVEITDIPQQDFTCNVFQHNADIYCFCSGYYENEETPYYIFKISKDAAASNEKWWEHFKVTRITDNLSAEEGGFYVPTILVNGKTPGYQEPYSLSNIAPIEGDYIEGYNLLGSRYKMFYSTVNKDLFQKENFNQAATYPLMYPVQKGDKVTVNVVLPTRFPNESYGMGGEHKTFTHEVVIEDPGAINLEPRDKRQDDGIYIGVIGRTLCLYDWDSDGLQHMFFTEEDFVDYNNLEIIACAPNSKENYEKVLNMTFCDWYGGGSEGIYDGIHLFMGGNTADKEKSLVCWSDFNKPLYFSENGYAYVGDKAQRVTAFGKQGENLIIFKERETYAAQYSSRDSVIDAEAVERQSIVDVTASEVVFPMVQVHGFIGCDCPNTVQLCRNRLVWAHSDGKIYTLVSANQWNERSIFEVSAMVEKKLKECSAEQLRKALSADWEGHYILSVGDNLYLMDYDSYGYANITAYSKNDDAQLHIPWWVWDKPVYGKNTYHDAIPATDSYIETEDCYPDVLSMVAVGNRLFMMAMFEASVAERGSGCYPELITFEGEDDLLPNIVFVDRGMLGYCTRETPERGKEIPAMAQTKLFTFGSPTITMSVPKAEISFGNNGGIPIAVTTITDRGETQREVVLDFVESDERKPQFFKNVVIRNGERINNRVGYRLESNGNIFLDSLSVYYKQLGGAK